MKILKLDDKDFDAYGDWLKPSAADMFASGNFTHIENQKETNECEITGVDSDGRPMVLVGKSVVVGFKIGKYYSHPGGRFLHILCKTNTTLWGEALIAESAGPNDHQLQAVGSDNDAAQNWEETTQEEWMANFS